MNCYSSVFSAQEAQTCMKRGKKKTREFGKNYRKLLFFENYLTAVEVWVSGLRLEGPARDATAFSTSDKTLIVFQRHQRHERRDKGNNRTIWSRLEPRSYCFLSIQSSETCIHCYGKSQTRQQRWQVLMSVTEVRGKDLSRVEVIRVEIFHLI